MDALAPDDFILDVSAGLPPDVLVLRRGALAFDPPVTVDDLDAIVNATQEQTNGKPVSVDRDFESCRGVMFDDRPAAALAFAALRVKGDEIRARLTWTAAGVRFLEHERAHPSTPKEGDPTRPCLWIAPALCFSSAQRAVMAIALLSVLTRPPCFGKIPPQEAL